MDERWYLWRRGVQLYIAPHSPFWFHGAIILASGTADAVLAAKRLAGAT